MNTALLIVDVQNDYFSGGKMELVGSREASQKILRILSRFREQSRPVLHIQHVARKEDATFFLPGTTGVEIHDSVKPEKGEAVIQKNYPNSFRGTTLEQACASRGVGNLVIVGMMTHMCIDTTTRAAFDLGYQCTVLADCCATKDLKYNDRIVPAADVQTSFLASLKGTFAEVIDSEEFLQREL